MKLKKNKKKIILILIPVVIVLLIILFIGGFVKDKNDSKTAMKKVEKDYKVFADDVVLFNNHRDNIYDTIFTNGYYDNFKDSYEEFNKTFDEDEKTVDKVTNDSKRLVKYCDGIYYTDINVNKMCSIFAENYETLINSFIVDVGHYNTLVKEYNEYLKENSLDSEELKEYTTSKKYIDYNKDKEYSGKE